MIFNWYRKFNALFKVLNLSPFLLVLSLFLRGDYFSFFISHGCLDYSWIKGGVNFSRGKREGVGGDEIEEGGGWGK